MKQIEKAQFKKLLGFCAAVKDGELCTHDNNGNPLFSHLRIEGYIAALQGKFVEQVVLFGPEHETAVITQVMLAAGVDKDRLVCHETHVTTQGNAQVMRKYLAHHDLKTGEVVGSTSHYHLPRAQLMGEWLHDLGIIWIAAEAFLFARRRCHTRTQTIQKKLIQEFGDSPLTQRIVSEIRGQGDLIAARYRSHIDRV